MKIISKLNNSLPPTWSQYEARDKVLDDFLPDPCYDLQSFQSMPRKVPQFNRSTSLNACSLPKNYSYGFATRALNVASESYISTEPLKYFRSRSTEPDFPSYRDQTFDSCQFREPGKAFESQANFRKPKAHLGFFPAVSTILSVDLETPRESLSEMPACDETCDIAQSFLNATRNEYGFNPCDETFSPRKELSGSKNELLSRCHTLVAEDKIIDVEYDSDVGWKTKNIRQLIKTFQTKQNDCLSDRGKLKLDLKQDLNDSEQKSSNEHKSSEENSKTSKPELTIEPLIDEVQSKLQIEGKIVPPNPPLLNNKRQAFARCRSRSSATSADDPNGGVTTDFGEVVVDDVFGAIVSKSSKKPLKLNRKGRSESSNALLAKKRNTFVESRDRSSSVSINDAPEYFTNESPNSSNVASSPAIAKLHTKPSRGSLKKSKKLSSSDYDRDRGRSRHMEGGHRESFKKNERTNSEQERDASDREHKEGTLNRSLSNTDTNLEDRIGKKTVT